MIQRSIPQLEQLETRECPTAVVVNTTADIVNATDTLTSLREAVLEVIKPTPAGQQPKDEIRFDIGGGEQLIRLAAANGALPTLNRKVLINATAPAEKPTQVIVLDGSLLPAGSNGLVLGSRRIERQETHHHWIHRRRNSDHGETRWDDCQQCRDRILHDRVKQQRHLRHQF